MLDIGQELQRAFDEGYAKGMEDATIRGRWEISDYGHYCTNCGEGVEDYRRTRYCGNCGALMED